MDNYKHCFIAKFEGSVYLIPQQDRELFDATPYYDREKTFAIYALGDDAVLESVYIDLYDYDSLVGGDFG